MANLDIRQKIYDAGLKHYEIAKEIGVSSFTLSVWLRDDLDGERLERVNNAIESLKKKRLSCFASKAE
ncbi:hypothetical protein [Agathobacter sp.]